jgi:hypothetical protein
MSQCGAYITPTFVIFGRPAPMMPEAGAGSWMREDMEGHWKLLNANRCTG